LRQKRLHQSDEPGLRQTLRIKNGKRKAMNTERVSPDPQAQLDGKPEKRKTIYYHYTTGIQGRHILKDGFIRPSTALIDPGEIPAVWFSSNPDWEPTAVKARRGLNGKMERLSMEETSEMGHGLMRFGVTKEIAGYSWNEIKEKSGMSPKTARYLHNEGVRQGARPHEWRGTFERVSRNRWVAVERFEEGRWVPIDYDGSEST
jgi:hypothetical protein